MQTQTQAGWQAGRQADRQTDRHRRTQTQTDADRRRHKHRRRHRQTQTQTGADWARRTAVLRAELVCAWVYFGYRSGVAKRVGKGQKREGSDGLASDAASPPGGFRRWSPSMRQHR
eukprot:14573454-Alexandrium_andersonii.AAC.1